MRRFSLAIHAVGSVCPIFPSPSRVFHMVANWSSVRSSRLRRRPSSGLPLRVGGASASAPDLGGGAAPHRGEQLVGELDDRGSGRRRRSRAAGRCGPPRGRWPRCRWQRGGYSFARSAVWWRAKRGRRRQCGPRPGRAARRCRPRRRSRCATAPAPGATCRCRGPAPTSSCPAGSRRCRARSPRAVGRRRPRAPMYGRRPSPSARTDAGRGRPG